MSVKVKYNEVLRVMQSGESHINLYKSHVHSHGANEECSEDDGHEHDHGEKHGLLHAHEMEQEENEDDQSVVSFYYEDE